MVTTKTYRYTLQPYATGAKTRHTCPACLQPNTFTRYLDTETGELLPDTYGRCNREQKCGFFRPPSHDMAAGLSTTAPLMRIRSKPRSLLPLPILQLPVTIPRELFTASLDPGSYCNNSLIRLLRKHFGLHVADELCRQFQLGTSSYWPGSCVFWLIDELGRVRGGQVVLFDETGHTVKHPYRHTCWAHTAFAKKCWKLGEPLPDWLSIYQDHGQKSPCLFGLPQLDMMPSNKPIAIVESAKTALWATVYMPEYIWMATMGKSYLNATRLAPLRGRRITLYPDAGAWEDWNSKAAELRKQGFIIEVSEIVEQVVTAEECAAGFDLADLLIRDWAGYPPSWDERG